MVEINQLHEGLEGEWFQAVGTVSFRPEARLHPGGQPGLSGEWEGCGLSGPW